MKFLASIALLITATSAIPVEKLFTLVTAGASTSSHNGLHVTTQSTGPLNSNAVFGPAATAAIFFASNEAVHYEAPNGGPWEMALVQSRDVKGAVQVSVSPTTGSNGFVVAGNGTLLVEGQTWGGWLVCEGSGRLSLNYVNTALGSRVPAGCDRVQLNAVVKTSL